MNYRNERTERFFENLAALFLTKHANYSFEQEWRLLKDVEECDEVIEVGGQQMYMCRVSPGMIKSVTFGYSYDRERLPREAAQLKVMFDPSIRIQSAYANRRTGRIEIEDLDSRLAS